MYMYILDMSDPFQAFKALRFCFSGFFLGVKYVANTWVADHSNESLTFTYWSDGEPAVVNGDCVVMMNGRWKVADCSSNQRIVCSLEAYGEFRLMHLHLFDTLCT